MKTALPPRPPLTSTDRPPARYFPIAEHGVVGDLRSAALASTDGTIDWYCAERFDGPRFGRAISNAAPFSNGDSPLQIMYRIDGGSDLDEEELTHLEGYRRSRPVRIGNGAASELQLDIYGALLDSIYIAERQALAGHGELIGYDDWRGLVRLIDWLCRHWHAPGGCSSPCVSCGGSLTASPRDRRQTWRVVSSFGL